MESKFLGMKNVLFSIINSGDKNSADYVIARYILEHYEQLKTVNIIDMATDCYVDRSTIRRFFQKYGFENFQEFKQNYSDEFEARYYQDVPFDNYNDYIWDLTEKIQHMMEQYSPKRDKTADVNNLIDRLRAAKNIALMGAECFYGNLYTIQQHMLAVGKVVSIVTSPAAENPVLKGMTEEDCILVLSLEGNYYKAIRPYIVALQCKKVLITLTAREEWKTELDHIAQLTREPETADREIWRKYAMTYYIDIMLNTYKMKYKGR